MGQLRDLSIGWLVGVYIHMRMYSNSGTGLPVIAVRFIDLRVIAS